MKRTIIALLIFTASAAGMALAQNADRGDSAAGSDMGATGRSSATPFTGNGGWGGNSTVNSTNSATDTHS